MQASGRHPRRKRYVVGIFAEPTNADRAMAALSASPAEACKVLMISDSALAAGTIDAADPAGANARGVSTFDVVAPRLRDALMTSSSFAALWESLSARPEPGHMDSPAAMQRLFHHLVHRLADGAAVVIVAAPDPDLQLLASRALLEAHCEVLLTHEVRERDS